MKLRKSNRSAWLVLGLALLLLGGSLAASTGTAYARYRAEQQIVIPFAVRAPDPVFLGVWETAEDGTTQVFTQKDVSNWDIAGNQSTLSFVAANGAAPDAYLSNDQQIHVRLVGSVGLLDSTTQTPPVITLWVPRPVTAKEEDPEAATETAEDPGETEQQYNTYTAVATPITLDSALGKTFGAGWIFTFHETEVVEDADGTKTTIQGEELAWSLKGGQFSTVDMKLTIANAVLSEQSILKLQVIGE